jgi:hypothetical protein
VLTRGDIATCVPSTSLTARVTIALIAAEAKLLWAGLKLQLTGFGNADSCDPHRLDEND